MERAELLIVGSGGQGIILAGEVIATGAMIDGKFASQMSTYSALQRGATVHSEVIISSAPIRFTFVRKPNLFIAMNQEGFEKFSGKVGKGALLLFDPGLVNVQDSEFNTLSIPATKHSTELNLPLAANLVMVGAFAAVTRLVSRNGIEKVVGQKFSNEFRAKNLEALERGYMFAEKIRLSELRTLSLNFTGPVRKRGV